ncbi:MAG TPA: site-specific integrase [Casimicrobiaceae bacterium]|nr:site-specific integrase [Casimicrobiaceae bacterium]
MGYIYARGSRLWAGFWDHTKKLHQKQTPFVVGQEDDARAALERAEAEVAAGVDTETIVIGPTTVKQHIETWSQSRMDQGVGCAFDDRTRLRKYAVPIIGQLAFDEVRPRHIRDLIRTLVQSSGLAPRSIRHVYGALHVMFRDAVVDEILPANPCVLKSGDLPRKKDKDPRWRPGAIFTRAEVPQLIWDDRIPKDRRVLYALLALAGPRFGEASAARWYSYDEKIEPLGRLVVATSWSTRRAIEKSTKTEEPRSVPIHPVFAEILTEWKQTGWREIMGRDPTPEDLIIPSRRGANRGVNHALRRFHEDLDRLGLRHRRLHDLRRTFISLAISDGARPDVLKRVTHGRPGDIMGVYTELPWETLCEDVGKLKIARPAPATPPTSPPDNAMSIEIVH